jgi:hypothetical protein
MSGRLRTKAAGVSFQTTPFSSRCWNASRLIGSLKFGRVVRCAAKQGETVSLQSARLA